MANKWMPFEVRQERTIVKVNVYVIGGRVDVHNHSREYDMTDHEWTLFLAGLDAAGIEYERMNGNVIVITKIIGNEKKEKES